MIFRLVSFIPVSKQNESLFSSPAERGKNPFNLQLSQAELCVVSVLLSLSLCNPKSIIEATTSEHFFEEIFLCVEFVFVASSYALGGKRPRKVLVVEESIRGQEPSPSST
jgi:hypothetical protein